MQQNSEMDRLSVSLCVRRFVELNKELLEMLFDGDHAV
jgi:hypothetical protein